MNALNEENIKSLLLALQKDILPNNKNPKIAARARLNSAKYELRISKGGDYWEDDTKENFFKTLRNYLNKTQNINKYKVLNFLGEYEKITPEHEYIKSNEELQDDKLKQNIDKENSKPTKQFNNKTGNYETNRNPHGVLSANSNIRKELDSKEELRKSKEQLKKAYNSGKHNNQPQGMLYYYKESINYFPY